MLLLWKMCFVVTFGAVARMYRLLVLTPDERLLGLVLLRVDNPGSLAPRVCNFVQCDSLKSASVPQIWHMTPDNRSEPAEATVRHKGTNLGI
jgi:hypothetical protein